MAYLPKREPPRPWKPPPKIQQGRKSDFSKIYNSTRHRKQRKMYLNENPFCVDCDKIGEVSHAVIFDHIIPLSQDSSEWATWSLDNKQGLCSSHHNQKSGRESQAAQKKKKDGIE